MSPHTHSQPQQAADLPSVSIHLSVLDTVMGHTQAFLPTSKELLMSRPVSVQAGFTGETFPWKRTGLTQVGEKGKSRGGKSPKFFVLRTYIVGGMGVKKLHID